MVPVVSPPAPVLGKATEAPRRRGRVVRLIVVVAAVAVLAGVLATTLGTDAPGPPSSSVGIAENRPVPASVLRIPLVDEHGQATSLGAFRGKIVVLASFLTSCQETCPLTTGAFLDMGRDLAAAGMASKVVFIEASVDPGRDLPGRLAAYGRTTGANWPLLTGTPSNMQALWSSFGIYSKKVAEANPPGVDWQTGKPYTYDVDHSDGLLVFDQQMHERFVTGAAPNLGQDGLPTTLKAMLDAQGLHNLAHPGRGSWTIPEGLQAIGWVAGRRIPQVSSIPRVN
ncbi:MAG TPA: SCO family protein [Acidimicrobiales bacterium]|nr:SCO family protein [Acidimicrobiales bacterium]